MNAQPDSTTDLDEAYRSWSAAAAAVLAKSHRVDVADLADTPENLLSTQTADGLTIRPLYTRRDELPEPGVPGVFPFVRGADPARDVTVGWRVTERFGDDPATTATAVNAEILDALAVGTSGLWLSVGGAIAPDDVPEVLDGVYLDLVPVTLDAGDAGVEAARAFTDVRAAAAQAPIAAATTIATTSSLGFSPLTAAFSGRATVDSAEATACIAQLPTAVLANVRGFRVDGADFATAGADNRLELALIVAAAVTHLRDLTAAGLTAEHALAQISFGVSVGADQFATIAKLRALRTMWARVAQVVGAPAAGAALTHAVTDLSMYSQRDPWVNMLRSTVAAFGAGVGGADQVTVLGFDAAIPADQQTSGVRFTRRIARNTQLLLLEESNVGRVIDPAGGSWFVESLTDDLASSAWSVFTDIEAIGGFRAVLDSGWIADRVGQSLARRENEVAHRRSPVTGVSEFPNLDEKPFSEGAAHVTDVVTGTPRLARIGRAFEALRDRSDEVLAATGARPTVLLLPLGSVAEHNARTTFVTNLLAAGGIAVHNPGPVGIGDVGALVAGVGSGAAGTDVAVICGSRQRYADDGPGVLAAARAAGIGRILVAGAATEWPTTDNQPDGSLRIGIDAIAALTDLFDALTTSHTSGAHA
ncbi:MAG: methylmalonyl-CoA mutase family protein [Gordonia sp. (in: high G+C Gram-positive bacteria)]